MSPLLVRLMREIKSEAIGSRRAELEARIAGYFARIGEFEEAKKVIKKVRIEFGAGQSGRVTICLMIAEALVHHYESLDSTALDRVNRAQLLARLLKEVDLEAIAWAWRAHIEFDGSRFKDMFVSLGEAASKSSSENNDARARISNVLCKTALLCGEHARAKEFFYSGRNYALKEGDQASIEALQHNKAAFRLAWSRTAKCLGELNRVELAETRVEIATAKSLQNIAGVRALSSYIKLCDGRLALLEDNFRDAIDLLSLIEKTDRFPLGSFTHQVIDLEKAYCFGSLGKIDEALNYYRSEAFEDISMMDWDDQVVVRWMQLRLCEINSVFGDASILNSRLDEAISKYNTFIDEIRSSLKLIVWL